MLFDYLAHQFEQNPDFPMLVSFPRTGSHWFRMIMELYLNEPSLVRSFFIDNPKSFWGIHRHDIETKIRNRNNVIYLYRNPVDTIYSEMVFNEKKFSEHLDHYINLYSNQVLRWVYNHDDTKNILILTYENMKEDTVEEVAKAVKWLNRPVDKDKIKQCCDQINKDKVKQKTSHDPKVICKAENYEECRVKFKEQYSQYILDEFKKKDERLVW